MSKLARMLTATMHPEKRYAMRNQNLKCVESKLDVLRTTGFETGYEMRLSVALGKRVIVSESDKEYIEEIKKDLRRAIIEEVFGEFRPYLLDLRVALHEDTGDKTKFRKLLSELEHRMFTDAVEDSVET